MEATRSTSHLSALAATSAREISGWTPNWLEYQAAFKLVKSKQRLKCSVAESDGHRKVTNHQIPLATRKEIHVVSNPNRGGWDAKSPHADRVSKHFKTKKEAMDWSRGLAKKEGLELIPHGLDGKIQNPNSYGNDHCPPKDTKH